MTVKIDSRCRYAETHEWVRIEGKYALAGISDHAQHELSDIVYVELPEVGDTITKGDSFAVVESVKAASDAYLPVSGEIVEVNEALEESPELVNTNPYGEGWLVKFVVQDAKELDELMDAEAYRLFVEQAEAEGGH
jgi:glycine cleavage system H protein